MTEVQISGTEAMEVAERIHEHLVRGSADPFCSFVEFSSSARHLTMDDCLVAWAEVASPIGSGGPTLSAAAPSDPLPGPDHLVGWPIESCYEIVKRCIESAKIRVEERPTFVYADGVPIGRCNGWTHGYTIAVDPSLEAVLRLHVLIHELAHVVLQHGDQLEFSDDRNQREVAAETIAWLVMKRLGFAAGVSSDYLLSWSRDISCDTLYEALEQIVDALDRCLEIIARRPWQGPRDPVREAQWTNFPLPGAIESCDD